MQLGDYVEITCNAANTVWQFGIIEAITGDEAQIGYGGRNTPKHLRLHGYNSNVQIKNLEIA